VKRVWLLVLGYLLVVGGLGLHRFRIGLNCIYDLGIHDQAVWLVAQGKNPFLYCRGLQVQADHFNPMAYFLAPVYWVWDDPRALLMVQTLWLACGAFPVYLLARRHLRKDLWAQGCALLYLCQPCLMFSNFFDFHFTTLLTTPLLWACYALESGNRRLYYVSLLTALACSETAPISVLALAPVAWWKGGWRRALFTCLLALAALQLSMACIRYHNHGQSIQYGSLYAHYGKDGKEVVRYLLTHPGEAFQRLNTADNREYLLQVFGPLGFLPFLGPLEMMPAVPVIMGNLLSWRESQHTIRYHYLAGILPFLMWASVVGVARLQSRWHKRQIPWYLGLCSLIGLAVGPLHPEEWPDPRPDFTALQADLDRLVPKQASLSVENNLGGAMCHRQQAFTFPNPLQEAAWGSRRQALVDQSVMGLDPPGPAAWRRALEKHPVQFIVSGPGVIGEFPVLRPDRFYLLGEICAYPGYDLIYSANGAVVFQQAPSKRRPIRVLAPSDWGPWREFP
jgi:uncharacterized membrane protein